MGGLLCSLCHCYIFKGSFRSVSRGIEIEIQTSEQLRIGYLTSRTIQDFSDLSNDSFSR